MYHTLSKLNQTAKKEKQIKAKELGTNLAKIVGETVIIVNDDNWAVGFFGGNRRTSIGLDRDKTQRCFWFWDQPNSCFER